MQRHETPLVLLHFVTRNQLYQHWNRKEWNDSLEGGIYDDESFRTTDMDDSNITTQ